MSRLATSTSNSISKLGPSYSGSATMVAFCSLENPEYDGQNVHFNAAIYLSPEKRANASLRYFNQANITFEIQGYYVVIAQISRSVPGHFKPFKIVEDTEHPESLKESDYQIVGDIICLYTIPNTAPLEADFDPRCFVIVSGLAINMSSENFDVDAHQYTWCISKCLEHPADSFFPIRAHFDPNDHRWHNRKPIPTVTNQFVQVQGFLDDYTLNTENHFPERFHIIVEQVPFLGRGAISRSTTTTITSPASTQVQGGRRLRADFNFGSTVRRAHCDDVTATQPPLTQSQKRHDSSPLSDAELSRGTSPVSSVSQGDVKDGDEGTQEDLPRYPKRQKTMAGAGRR